MWPEGAANRAAAPGVLTRSIRECRSLARAGVGLLAALCGVAVPCGVAVLCGAALAACAREAPGLRVFAAASLTEVVEALAEHYDSASVLPSFGASSVLARQIRDGAPADVFLSASPHWIDFLADAGMLSGEPVLLARNRLVGIAARGGPLSADPLEGPRALLEHLEPEARVAIADEGVPAGEYVRAALDHLSLLPAFRRHLVGLRDVRAVLRTVEQRELAAGFVYATDARLAAIDVLFAFDPSTHPPIEYRAAALRAAPHSEEAHRFLEFLQSETARTLLTSAGFALP